jgi:hypothetical protein
VNAIDVAVRGLAPVVAAEPLEVEVGGLTFVEVLSATRIEGGIAATSSPTGSRSGSTTGTRRDREPAEAEERLRELVGGEVEITANSPPAHVATDSELVDRPPTCGRPRARAEAGVDAGAEFAAQGLDASISARAQHATRTAGDERVEITELERTFETLLLFRVELACGRDARLSRPIEQGTYPFVRIERAKREAAAGRCRDSRLRAGAILASRPTR